MKLTSVFKEGESIPSKYTCDGANETITLSVSDVPSSAKSLALIMDDPDIPNFVKKKFGITEFVHWVLFNIAPNVKTIGPSTHGVNGKNSSGENKYAGPCPPDKEHRYFFRLYALDKILDLKEGATKEQALDAMKGHVLAEEQLIGRYNRVK
ncbi:YbhB/YbcL family Raf kinase inhibitor-like protein [Candidatus Woesearchaeota archaeon]|nr:YbhB/YbcL family Raf kinase inhibitor-like protein [Candidatus Woesearchaeota archaeon]